jgi:PTH1 family peptidyl-tRNA hydrolase
MVKLKLKKRNSKIIERGLIYPLNFFKRIMFLIVGLGNIGKEYENTRHNFGFLTVDEIIKKYNFGSSNKKFSSEFYQGKIDGEDVIIIKPQTYMNKSGVAVSQVKKFYKVPIENIIVFHDDLDLELGKIKVKVGGGAGGHNGLKSIDGLIGKNYIRVRLGIGRPEHKDAVHSYVLGKFNKEEQKIVDDIRVRISDLISDLFEDRVGFLNRFYSK